VTENLPDIETPVVQVEAPFPAPMPHKGGVSLGDLQELDAHVSGMLDSIKRVVFRPDERKKAPVCNASQLASLCGRSGSAMGRLLDRAAEFGLSDGYVRDAEGKKTSAHRAFPLADAMAWIQHSGTLRYKRTSGQDGAVICVGFFKGGVGKTTIAVSLAQGLSLRGYKVLAIDLDPQGSMTTMLGRNPGAVEIGETIVPLTLPRSASDHRDELAPSIRPTYWQGVDLVAGSTGLFISEFYLPMRATSKDEAGFNFLEVLQRALVGGVREKYDYIVIDTPPALSYITMNAYWAADAVLLPVVPEGLSLQSSAQFWSMFNELAESAQKAAAEPKRYAWLGVVPSRVEAHKPGSVEMLKWLQMCYPKYLMSSHIPITEAVRTGSTEFATVYDISKYAGSAKTYERARAAFDALTTEVDLLTRREHWHAKEE